MAQIPNYHIILEQLAHRYAYESPDLSEADDYAGAKDKQAEQAATLKKIGFRKGKSVASSVTGFQVTCFIPFVQSNARAARCRPLSGALQQHCDLSGAGRW